MCFENKKRKALEERSFIEANKQFQRLGSKSQVLTPDFTLSEVSKTRFSHSYEVANSAELMISNIAYYLNSKFDDIDYNCSVFNISLLHDIGHPPFGHDGADFISDFFHYLGVPEGFSDNNNNLTVIYKNDIDLRDYTLVSTIKYPEKLYDNQKDVLEKLDVALREDFEHFKTLGINLKKQKTTIACQIMDEADRNSYTCSDLSDFFCLGNKISLDSLKDIDLYDSLTKEYKDKLNFLILDSNLGKKNQIKKSLNQLKCEFNANYTINENGLIAINKDLLNFREFLNNLEYEFFIKPLKATVRVKNLKLLENFVHYVINNEHYPSEYYKDKILNSDDEIEKLRYIRDMVSEVSDWYVLNFSKNKEI